MKESYKMDDVFGGLFQIKRKYILTLFSIILTYGVILAQILR